MNSKTITGLNHKKVDISDDDSIELANNKDINYFFRLVNYNDNLQKSDNQLDCLKRKQVNTDVTNWIKSNIGQFKNIETLRSIDRKFTNCYYDVLQRYKIYESIDTNAFNEILDVVEVPFYLILANKHLVEKYDNILCEKMLKVNCIRDLMIIYENSKGYYLPNSLTDGRINEILLSYIQSEKVNPNTLNRIINSNNRGGHLFKIYEQTKFEASKRNDKYWNDNREAYSTGLEFKVNVSFENLIDDYFILRTDPSVYDIKYDRKWIQENNDFATLLNNFIYLFCFVNSNDSLLSSTASYPISVLEEFQFHHKKNTYRASISFSIHEMIKRATFEGYYMFLKNNLNIRLEEVIQWFFSYYLSNEFNVQNFKFYFEYTESYRSKCMIVFSCFEAVMKQFQELVNKNYIDNEFLKFSTSPISFNSVKSLNKRKYAYISDDKINNIFELLFDEKSILSILNNHASKYDTFYEVIKNEDVSIDKFDSYDLEIVNTIVDSGYITIKSGRILINKEDELNVLKSIYKNKYMSAKNFEKNSKYLKLFEEHNVISYLDTLLTPEESDYFSYYLDNKNFDNGLSIRNAYAHGFCHLEDDESVHKDNYFIMLRLLICIVIKINDDLCIYDKQKNIE